MKRKKNFFLRRSFSDRLISNRDMGRLDDHYRSYPIVETIGYVQRTTRGIVRSPSCFGHSRLAAYTASLP